ncbi:glycerate kinase [Flaviflexus huanghaiensis]|uniref:glycerate kinase n=1 Tax=Flaviflexus huanghaiensis TaxID=1111473 RepID=UPI0015FE69C5|nr:glycerate kinase [Flaviflexus huanghaiensis]
MAHIVVVSDSFKGALTSAQAHAAIADGVRRALPGARVTEIPVADGGEGTVAAMLAATGGTAVDTEVCGVFPGERVSAGYGLMRSTPPTAIVEMASCAGLPLAEGRTDSAAATTYGVGELVIRAAEAGAIRIIVGAGGSATTDLGCGAAAALGVRFFNSEGAEFVPVGATLCHVAAIDVSVARKRLAGVSLTVMCDIDNPLVGPNGAAHVFSPQKGADPETVTMLDDGLVHVARIISRDLGVDIANVPGAGAAGGLAGGLMAFCEAELQQGIDTVLEAVDFASVMSDADLVLTGEGQIDGQSLSGKVPVGVARWVTQHRGDSLPVVVLTGSVGDGIDGIYAEGITAVFSIGRGPQNLAEAMKQTASNLAASAFDVVRLYSSLVRDTTST